MLPDHYKQLGVSSNATEDEIKKAFRGLAKKWHPDKNNEPGAEEKFKEINAAYECLSSKEKRSEYDRDVRMSKFEKKPEQKATSSKSGTKTRTRNTKFSYFDDDTDFKHTSDFMDGSDFTFSFKFTSGSKPKKSSKSSKNTRPTSARTRTGTQFGSFMNENLFSGFSTRASFSSTFSKFFDSFMNSADPFSEEFAGFKFPKDDFGFADFSSFVHRRTPSPDPLSFDRDEEAIQRRREEEARRKRQREQSDTERMYDWSTGFWGDRNNQEPEEAQYDIYDDEDLIQCTSCSKLFIPAVLTKHEPVCKRLHRTRATDFNYESSSVHARRCPGCGEEFFETAADMHIPNCVRRKNAARHRARNAETEDRSSMHGGSYRYKPSTTGFTSGFDEGWRGRSAGSRPGSSTAGYRAHSRYFAAK